MRKVKKYANGKLYDTVDRKYLSKDRLAELLKTGEKITVIDKQTEEDVTAEVLAKIMPESEKDAGTPGGGIVHRIKKESEDFMNRSRKYVSDSVSRAGREIESLKNRLSEGISDSELGRMKKEIEKRSAKATKWIGDTVDRSVDGAMDWLNIASKRQMRELLDKIGELNKKIDELEKNREKYDAGKKTAKVA